MKVINIQLGAYMDGWTYQDNLLPAFQHILGHEVWHITTNYMYDKAGHGIHTNIGAYDNEDGVHVIRLEHQNVGFNKLFDNYKLYPILQKIEPDYVFIHNLYNFSAWQVIKYMKHINPNCVLVFDNHQDEYNHSRNKMTLKGKLVHDIQRVNTRLMLRYADGIFGVTEGRTQYAIDVYGANPSKTKTLLMGVDDRLVEYEKRSVFRKKIADKLKLCDDTFWIVSGGKLDKDKAILELMDAYERIPNKKTMKLILFGSVSDDIEVDFRKRIDDRNIFHLGFLSAKEIYELFISSDLGVFPGGHSVLWEQAVGCGLPCLFQYRKGMTHVDVGGNCIFLRNTETSEIYEKITEIINDEDKYLDMKNVAVKLARKEFSYSEIARKSLSVQKLR